MGLNGLLIKIGSRSATAVKSVTADGPEVAIFRHLHFRQPAQDLQSAIKYNLLPGGVSTHDHGVRKFRVDARWYLLFCDGLRRVQHKT